ncbi:hypothetical protein CIT31_02540 [Mesorhizobium wenxiniae]|uniref:Uncharacterized protein n=2 Tax=Mesorhizobium wenxiniae TaxID=2014805 RepID=A0A271KLD1_9HYPH|nr:hypothetical protein CIT31_02540 [Mesorhizobium wenxiniae]
MARNGLGGETVAREPYGFEKKPLLGGGFLRLEQSTAKPWQKEDINTLLRRHHPELGREPIKYGPTGPKPLTFTDDEWNIGLELAETEDERLNAVRGRFNAAVALIVNGCADGSLVSFLRPRPGGGMSAPLSTDKWWSEQIGTRLYWCQMDPSEPFGRGVGGDAYQYIYISRNSLDHFKQKLAGKMEKAEPEPEAAPALVTPLPTENSGGTVAKKTSSQREAIDRAVKELWDGQPPQGLTVERRDERIQQFAKTHELSVPSSRTIRRHFQSGH